MSAAATMACLHVCPMVTGIIPHVGGPILEGLPLLTIDEMAAATEGSMAVCVGPPDAVVLGMPNLTVGGMPIAFMGSVCEHGGDVVLGLPNLLVG